MLIAKESQKCKWVTHRSALGFGNKLLKKKKKKKKKQASYNSVTTQRHIVVLVAFKLTTDRLVNV